ncbi:MAG: metallophosphoesterase [Ignavibacteria bacterium]
MKQLLILFLFLTTTLNAQVKFAMFGDYGCDEPPELAVSNLVKSWNPDFIVTLGDNNYFTYSGDSIDYNVGKYYHEYIKPYLGSFGSGSSPVNRFYSALGNHDFYDFLWFGPGDLRYAGHAYYNYFKLTDTAVHKGNTPDTWSPAGVRYYTFRKGNVQFFIANSGASPDDHSQQLFSEPDGIDSNSVQAQWFKTQLQNSTAKWKIVVMHHPPYSSVQPGLENAYKDLRWNFKNWGASVVLSGHNHIYESLVINGFPYFVCGLGGEDVGQVQPSYPGSRIQYVEKFGSIFCLAYNDSLIFKFINVDNEEIDRYKLVTAQNDAGVNFARLTNDNTLFTGGSYCFYAQIKNFGANDLIFVPVEYTINGGSPVGPVATGAIYNNDSTVVSFCENTAFNPLAAGTYTLKFFSTLAGDTIHENDTSTLVLTVIDSSRDAGVLSVNPVSEESYTGLPVSFNALIKNFGIANLPVVPVSYTVNDTGGAASVSTSELNSGDSSIVIFTEESAFTPPAAGTYILKFFTTLPGDTNFDNDTSAVLLTVIDPPIDAGVISAASIQTGPVYTGTSVSFNAVAQNFGLANLSSIPVSYKVEGDTNIISLNTGALNSGDTTSIIFNDTNSFTPIAAGSYVLKFYTSLEGDNNFNNDTTIITLSVIDSSVDAGVITVNTSTAGPFFTGMSISFSVLINNFGLASLSSIPVSYIVDGGPDVITLNSGSLNSGDTALIIFTDSNSFTPSSSGSYVLKFYTTASRDTNFNNDTTTLFLNVIDSVGATFFVSVMPEGLYNRSTGHLNLRDTVNAYLRQIDPPYLYIDHSAGVIDSVSFEGQFMFENAPDGDYYLVIDHRNSIETWSEFSLNVITSPRSLHYYNFVSQQTSAFGNNLIKVDSVPNKFAIFSGDVNQDGFVNLSDIILITNDASNFTTGYAATDLTGDLIVNLNDILPAFNNSNRFARIRRP